MIPSTAPAGKGVARASPAARGTPAGLFDLELSWTLNSPAIQLLTLASCQPCCPLPTMNSRDTTSGKSHLCQGNKPTTLNVICSGPNGAGQFRSWGCRLGHSAQMRQNASKCASYFSLEMHPHSSPATRAAVAPLGQLIYTVPSFRSRPGRFRQVAETCARKRRPLERSRPGRFGQACARVGGCCRNSRPKVATVRDEPPRAL